MKIFYKSEDGNEFDTPTACARYEIYNVTGLLEKIQSAMLVARHQDNWCGASSTGWDKEPEYFACACMGCVNSYFYDLGLTVHHWRVWYNDFCNLTGGASSPWQDEYTVDIYLDHVNDQGSRLEVFQLMRSIMRDPDSNAHVTATAVKQVLDGSGTPVLRFIEPQDADQIKSKFEELGATVTVKRSC